MTRYVYRDGELVDRRTVEPPKFAKSENFSVPRISRFQGYDSPIDGHWVSSDRQRERDLAVNDAYDRRDLPKDFVPVRGRDVQLREKRDADRDRGETRKSDVWGQFDNDTVAGARPDKPA